MVTCTTIFRKDIFQESPVHKITLGDKADIKKKAGE